MQNTCEKDSNAIYSLPDVPSLPHANEGCKADLQADDSGVALLQYNVPNCCHALFQSYLLLKPAMREKGLLLTSNLGYLTANDGNA